MDLAWLDYCGVSWTDPIGADSSVVSFLPGAAGRTIQHTKRAANKIKASMSSMVIPPIVQCYLSGARPACCAISEARKQNPPERLHSVWWCISALHLATLLCGYDTTFSQSVTPQSSQNRSRKYGYFIQEVLGPVAAPPGSRGASTRLLCC